MMNANSGESSTDPGLGTQCSIEQNDKVKFTFDLLDDVNRLIKRKADAGDVQGFLSLSEIRTIIKHHLAVKDPEFSSHGHQITHFILYLNTKLENANWVKEDDVSFGQNLSRYIHGNPISTDTYYKIVEILKLKSFMSETIMCTPYSFCRDLVDIILNKIKCMDGISQLIASEDLILSWMKSVKRQPVKPTLEAILLTKFNEALVLIFKDVLCPFEVKKLQCDNEQKALLKYNGYRVRSIFKIFVDIIKFQSNPNQYKQHPMYTLKPICSSDPDSSTDTGNTLFKKLFDIIMYKCMNMCDFTIDTWLSWYEVEVIEEDTNIQACIGHLVYELCTFIDNGIVNEPYLKEFRGILRNMSIKKLDFTNVDITDIDKMIDCIQTSSKFHISEWIKKMIQNTNVYTHTRAINTLDRYMKCIDYNCLKCFIDSIMDYYKNGGVIYESLINVVYKGIKNLDMDDKINILRHFMMNYSDLNLFVSDEFDKLLSFICHNEHSNTIDIREIMSKMIWLTIQQPKKMLHKLISQYITGVYGLSPKALDARQSYLHQITVEMHLRMKPINVYEEYISWLDVNKKLLESQQISFRQWCISASRTFGMLKPKPFTTNVLLPLLVPSKNYAHSIYLVHFTKLFLNECQMASLTDIDKWDKLLVQLANLLEDSRWNIENYSRERVELCEKIIVTLQPLLHYAAYIVKQKDIENIKELLSTCHLLTVSHFLPMWGSDYIVIEGMDEQFIMTVQSQSHISYSNLNRSSTQKSQEEFIFSIATYMPKFTLHEIKSFIANYLSSAKAQNIFDATFFLFDSVMNALMRIIVFVKTAKQDGNECHWDYVENAIVNFLDAVNTSKMACIYSESVDVKLATITISKIIMVIKQVDNARQFPLLVVLRRMIDATYVRFDLESISKLLMQLTSIKSQNYKETMGYTVEILVRTLNSKKNPDQ